MRRRFPVLLLALVLALGLLTGCATLRGIREDMLADEKEETTATAELPDETPVVPETETQQTPAVTAAPDPTAAMYSAYREIVQDRERQYGLGQKSVDGSGSGIYWMTGVACVALRDLDRDGVDELLLWENTLTNNFPNAAQIEIWSYRNGAAVSLYIDGARHGGDPSGQSLEFLPYGGETLLVTGFAGGDLELEYYALRSGTMVRVHTLQSDYDDPTICYLDGAAISSDDAWDMLMSAESLCNACEMTAADADAILNRTQQTRAVLGL